MNLNKLHIDNFVSKFINGLVTWQVFTLLFILNIIFKLFYITAESIWYDECFSIFFSQGSISDTMTVSRWDINPPFFYILLKYWMKVFGNGEFSVRFINVLFSSAGAVALYLYMKEFTSNKTAWIASIIFLLSDLLFDYSHEVRGYSLIIFCGFLSSYFFIKQIKSPSLLYSFLLACSWYGLIMTNYLTFFVLIMQGIVVLLYFREVKFKFFIYTVIIFLLLIYHWMDRLYEIITQGQHSAVSNIPTSDDFIHLWIEFLNGSLMVYFWGGIVLLTIVLISFQFKAYETRVKQFYSPMVLYSFLLATLPVILAYFLSVKLPMFLDRYLLFTLVGLIPFLAILFTLVFYKDLYYVIGIVVVIVLSSFYINLNHSNHMNYRDAVAYVKKKEGRERLIMVQTTLALFSYYYDRSLFNDRFGMEKEFEKRDVFVGYDSMAFSKIDFKKYKQVILVQTFENFTDPTATVDSMLTRRFNKLYRSTEFEGVVISEYKR